MAWLLTSLTTYLDPRGWSNPAPEEVQREERVVREERVEEVVRRPLEDIAAPAGSAVEQFAARSGNPHALPQRGLSAAAGAWVEVDPEEKEEETTLVAARVLGEVYSEEEAPSEFDMLAGEFNIAEEEREDIEADFDKYMGIYEGTVEDGYITSRDVLQSVVNGYNFHRPLYLNAYPNLSTWTEEHLENLQDNLVYGDLRYEKIVPDQRYTPEQKDDICGDIGIKVAIFKTQIEGLSNLHKRALAIVLNNFLEGKESSFLVVKTKQVLQQYPPIETLNAQQLRKILAQIMGETLDILSKTTANGFILVTRKEILESFKPLVRFLNGKGITEKEAAFKTALVPFEEYCGELEDEVLDSLNVNYTVVDRFEENEPREMTMQHIRAKGIRKTTTRLKKIARETQRFDELRRTFTDLFARYEKTV